ncbi:hypothetical protein BDF19DRAFT_442253 [Syncephalis fuscata]|nr:hypothetical protein BDF19DRAFT_442253 [Syncephalis fuscata]
MVKYETAVTSETLQRDGARFASAGSPLDVALAFTHEILGVKQDDYIVLSHYKSSGMDVTHVDLKQVLNGTPIENTSIRVHVDRNNHVCTYEDRFFHGDIATSLASPRYVSIRDAFKTLAGHLGQDPADIQLVEGDRREQSIEDMQTESFTNPDRTKRAFGEKTYYHVEDISIEPAWKFLVSLPMHEYEAFVSSDGKKVIAKHDRVISC